MGAFFTIVFRLDTEVEKLVALQKWGPGGATCVASVALAPMTLAIDWAPRLLNTGMPHQDTVLREPWNARYGHN